MALTCTLSGLEAITSGALIQSSQTQKVALRILFLYRQLNPSTSGAIPADTLLSQAACFDCGPSDTLLDAFWVMIQRQRAIDAGYSAPAFDAKTELGNVNSLTNLPLHRLKAIETMLRCQNA